MRKIALVTSLIMMITATACSSCATKTEEQEIVVPIYETDEIDYKTETAEIGDITEKYYVDGMFGTTDTEKVLFKVDGRIKSVSVEEGDEVRQRKRSIRLQRTAVRQMKLHSHRPNSKLFSLNMTTSRTRLKTTRSMHRVTEFFRHLRVLLSETVLMTREVLRI
jgi:multidrug efflux pump subunit AcrA (membrane-fusion protein)